MTRSTTTLRRAQALLRLAFSTARPRRRRGRLVRQYFLIFVALTAGGLIASGLLEIYFRYHESREEIGLRQAQVAGRVAADIAAYFLQIEKEMKIASTNRAIANRRFSAEYKFELMKLLSVTPAITDLVAIDERGEARIRVSRFHVVPPEAEADYSKASGFLQARQGVTFFSPVFFADDSDPYITVAVAVERFPGSVIGVLEATVSLRYVGELIRDLKVGKTGSAYVVSRSGDIVAHSESGVVPQRRRAGSLEQVKRALQPAPFILQPQTLVSRDIDGRRVLSAYAYLPGLDWAVIVERPLAEAYVPLYASVARTSTLLFFGLGIALLASVVVARRVVRPLEALRRGVETIGRGNLDHRLEIKTGDEIEILAEAFNRMVGDLKKSYQRLEDQVAQRTRELSALFDITATATRSLDVEPVLGEVTAKIKEIFGLDATTIYLFSGERETLSLKARFGDTLEFPSELRVGQGLLGKVVESGEPLIFEDIQREPRYDRLSRTRRSKEAGYRFLALFPVRAKGGVVGAISSHARGPRSFTPGEVRLIVAMADQIGVAIENLTLFEEVKAKTEAHEQANRELVDALARQTAVAEVLRVMAASPLNSQALLDSITAHVVRLARATGGVIRLLEEQGLVFVSHCREEGSRLEELQKLPPRPDEDSATTRAIREGRPVQIVDIANVGPDFRGPVPQTPARTVMAAPMFREGAPVGAIVVYRDVVEPFSESEIELAATFADEAAVALENVRLFRELQARTAELARSNRELQATNRRLQELDQLRSRFVSSVSHELRTPLTAIQGMAENMLDGIVGPLNRQQLRYAGDIKDSAERLARLIDDLLDLSVIEVGRIELRRARFPIGDLIAEVAAALTPLANEKRVRLSVAPAAHGLRGWADRDKIVQVLTNLIGNALKFTPPEGRVTVGARRAEDGWVELSVSDTGPGIPPQEIEKIFLEFYKIDRNGSRGVGLGLAISKKLVELHGGRIWVQSREESGSTFFFTLPAAGNTE
ncbi:MAG TPA: GAF domain-containing protein [candidate division Zixibacteria bacterium]|nr:GAF domain-containing protein [candidate division Zixibacteria bacterium]